MGLEEVVANLVQKLERRFYGKYRGFVKDNADPEQLGRLKVTVPSVLGDQIAVWAFPCLPYGGDTNQGFLFIPDIEAGVWIEFEEGDPEFPIWVGTFWSKPGGESQLPKPNGPDGSEQGAVQDPPTRKIIKTKKGHTIQLEDADGHDGRLPQSDTFHDLLSELQPYVVPDDFRDGLPLGTCPLSAAYEENPRPYEWNTELSGRDVALISEGNLPFSCTYHHRDTERFLQRLRQYLIEMHGTTGPNKELEQAEPSEL